MAADSTTRQEKIVTHRIDLVKAGYPHLWQKIVDDWQSESSVDAAWLTYSANYLLRTAGVRWALDPYYLFSRISGGIPPDFARDLARLQIVVLTHAHNDHFDRDLLAGIRSLPITWVIPDFMRAAVDRAAGIPPERVISLQPGSPIRFGPLTLVPFNGLHIHGKNGVPAMGYLAEFNGKRWLFPGDVRSYCSDHLPDFGDLDGAFAHLWLGKGCALELSPPLLDEFCRFFASLRPRRLVVTHLQEWGRRPEDFWDLHHFQLAQVELARVAPDVAVGVALTGQRARL